MRALGEQQAGRLPQLDDRLLHGCGHGLAGPDRERDARPAPGVDVHAQRAVRLRVGALRHSRLVAVADVLAAHELCTLQRADGLHHLDRLVAQRVGVGGDRGLHREQADHLHEVVLHDVPQAADAVVERAAALDAERLGHRHLHALDVIAVPDRLEQRVREAEHHQVLHGLLAEEVVDAVDRVLGEVLVQERVELDRAGEVAPERLLDDDPAAARDADPGQSLGDVVEQEGRDGEVADGMLRLPQRSRAAPGRWRRRCSRPGRSAAACTGA